MATGFRLIIESDQDNLRAVLGVLAYKASPVGLTGYLEKAVDPFLRKRAQDRFASEGDDVTGSWHPLTLATQIMRARSGFSPAHPINVRTGKLKDMLVLSPADVKPTGVGSTLTYPGPIGDPDLNRKMETAQRGLTNPKTPARPVVGLNENDVMFITSSLVAWLAEDFL